MGNTGAQMGGWYPQGDKDSRRHQGPEDAHRWLRRNDLGEARWRAAEHSRWRDLSGTRKGTIDATEWVGPYDDEKLGFHKVAKFYYYPGWWEGGPQISLYINQAAWDKLPKDYQAIVEIAAGMAQTDMLARYDAKNPAALRRLIGAGTQLRPFSRAIMEGAWKAANEHYAELNNTNPRWKKMYEDYARFRDDQIRWSRVTENTFDDFMASVTKSS